MDWASYDSWLESVCVSLRGLSSRQRVHALATLLDETASASERWEWQQRVAERLTRDLLGWLPPELSWLILELLPARDLFSAAQVSTIWRDRVDGALGVWKRQAHLLGAISPGESADVKAWKQVVRASCRTLQLLKTGRALSLRFISGLVRPPVFLVAVDHHLGHLAAATVDTYDAHRRPDRLLVVRLSDGSVVYDVAQSREGIRVASVKLLFPHYLAAGHLDGTVGLWGFNDSKQFQHHELVGHGGTIFSLDGDLDLDLLISGSADYRVRVWNLSQHALVRCLSTHDHWVVTVLLRKGTPNTLVTVSKREIHVFRWRTTEELQELSSPHLIIPQKPEGIYQELRDPFFTPGVHLSAESEITFVRQMPLFETQTIGDADIVTVDVHSGKLIRSFHINQKVRKLLAVGERFALALLPFVDSKYKNLVVIDLREKKIIGGCSVPHSRASTPDFSQVFIGPTEWLNGFSVAQEGAIAGMSLQDGSIAVVSWNFT